MKNIFNISIMVLGVVILVIFFTTLNNKDNDEETYTETEIDAYYDSSDETKTNEITRDEDDDIMDSMAQLEKPTDITIDTSKDYKAVLKTDKGDITINLNEKETPITVNNFVYLANNDFYNGVIFHRVMKGFMIQSGDPTGTGAGSPGYRFDDEPFEGEYTKGTIAMANAGPNTNGSQFFIMHADYPLPPSYVIFGQVEEGLDVVDAIATDEVTTSPSGEPSKPVNPVVINSVEIIES